MNIGKLFEGICDIPDGLKNIEVTGVTSDTLEFESGFVFVCIKANALTVIQKPRKCS